MYMYMCQKFVMDFCIHVHVECLDTGVVGSLDHLGKDNGNDVWIFDFSLVGRVLVSPGQQTARLTNLC